MRFLNKKTGNFLTIIEPNLVEYMIRLDEFISFKDNGFNESSHPRDKNGKFSSGSGGSASGSIGGISKMKANISTADKPTGIPATAGELSYKEPSSRDEKKFDNHKIYNGGEHTHTIGQASIGSNEYIVKNKKTGEVTEHKSKEEAFASLNK